MFTLEEFKDTWFAQSGLQSFQIFDGRPWLRPDGDIFIGIMCDYHLEKE